MAYVGMAELRRLSRRSRGSGYGMGQTPEQFELQASGLEANAQQLRSAGQDAAAIGLEQQAAALRQRAANDRSSAATQKAVMDITGGIVNAGAQVGGAYLQSEAARRAAKNSGGQPVFVNVPAQQSGGISAGMALGIGALLIGAVAVAVVATRKDD